MAYCPICGRDHDPDLLCTEQANHSLRRAGIEKKSKMSALEVRQLSRKAGRSSIILLVRIAGVSFLVVTFFCHITLAHLSALMVTDRFTAKT